MSPITQTPASAIFLQHILFLNEQVFGKRQNFPVDIPRFARGASFGGSSTWIRGASFGGSSTWIRGASFGGSSIWILEVDMYVYLLRSRDWPEQKYVGVTTNFERRFDEHNSGRCIATHKFRPWRCEVKIWFDAPHKAERFEKYLKSGSGRAFAQKRLWSF